MRARLPRLGAPQLSVRRFRAYDAEAQRANHPSSNRRNSMHKKTFFFIVAMALVAAPQFALADGDGAVTGVVGGAVTGAVVGGPVGAVVGGVAGGVIGNAASGPDRRRVVQPV